MKMITKSYLTKTLVLTMFMAISISCENSYDELNNSGQNQEDFKKLLVRPDHKLTPVASSNYQWTGVAVSDEGRVFVNFPRWGEIPMSVAEIEGGNLKPYPDIRWNSWGDGQSTGDKFVCVQSVFIDDENNLWVLDAGSFLGTGVVNGAPKLIKFNLASNSLERVYPMDEM